MTSWAVVEHQLTTNYFVTAQPVLDSRPFRPRISDQSRVTTIDDETKKDGFFEWDSHSKEHA
jgi:hypothetical protein